MSRFADVLKNIILANRKPHAYYHRVFVVSAYNNVTNWLLEHKKTGEPGIYINFVKNHAFNQALDSLLQKLIEINHGFADLKLDLGIADQFIADRINQARNYLNSLADVLATGYISKSDIHLAAREILASIGEAHSAFNSVNIIKNHGVNALFVDLCGFNDSEYLTIDERISKAFKDIDFSQVLPIATGFTKGTEGIMREFDRGYSEVTFSKIAVALKVNLGQIAELEGLRKDKADLFRLRNEVTQLRRQGAAPNSPAKSSRPSVLPSSPSALPPGRLISKDELVFVGRATPEETIQSMTWAAVKGTYEDTIANFSPELQQHLADPKVREELEQERLSCQRCLQGLQILARKNLGEDSVELKVKVDQNMAEGEAAHRLPELSIVRMIKLGNEWKYHRVNRDPQAWDQGGGVELLAQ